jgi:predicted Fe-Mo cluster-binding NifX family protein
MQIAVTATGMDLGCEMDPRFGRAAYLVFFDTDRASHEVHDNAGNVQSVSGAGVQAAKTVVDRGAAALITGNVGPKALDVLHAGGVDVYTGVSGTVQEALRRFEAGQLQRVLRASMETRWG